MLLSNIRLEVLQVQKGHAERNQYRFIKLDADTNQPKTGQQDLTKPAENDTNTKEDKKEMEGSEGLGGSTNPSNIKKVENNNNNTYIGEHTETRQIPQTPQNSPENSQNSNKVSENPPPDQNNNAAAPQEPAKLATIPAALTPHLDAQAQANPQVPSPRPGLCSLRGSGHRALSTRL